MKTSRRHRLTKVLPPNLQGRSPKVAELLRTPVAIANSPRASRVRRRYPKRKLLRRPRTVATTRTTNLKRQHPSLKPNPRRKRTCVTGILRTGIEPVTLGCQINHYSPTLFQLSYRRLKPYYLQMFIIRKALDSDAPSFRSTF